MKNYIEGFIKDEKYLQYFLSVVSKMFSILIISTTQHFYTCFEFNCLSFLFNGTLINLK